MTGMVTHRAKPTTVGCPTIIDTDARDGLAAAGPRLVEQYMLVELHQVLAERGSPADEQLAEMAGNTADEGAPDQLVGHRVQVGQQDRDERCGRAILAANRITAYVQAAGAAGVPTAVEISRSGQGGHVWTYFREPVPALDARALGFGLLREAMAVRGELGLESYDRFFPSQDYLPVKGEGLGNLIALPLQKRCRDAGTTVFVEPITFMLYPDQWSFLAGATKLGLADVQRLVGELRPIAVGPDATRVRSTPRPEPTPPKVIHAEWSGMLAIRRAGPASVTAGLAQARRLGGEPGVLQEREPAHLQLEHTPLCSLLRRGPRVPVPAPGHARQGP
jgi:TOTE conflict system, Archaeo-Eukaryotic Primase domain